MPDTDRKTNQQIFERVAILETQIGTLCDELIRMRTNDLAHIEAAIEKHTDRITGIEKKLAMGVGALAVIQVLMPLVYHYLFGV